jgi:hypothetical protein
MTFTVKTISQAETLGRKDSNEEIFSPPPCGFLIGIYIFYEHWSTETFRKSGSKKRGGSV